MSYQTWALVHDVRTPQGWERAWRRPPFHCGREGCCVGERKRPEEDHGISDEGIRWSLFYGGRALTLEARTGIYCSSTQGKADRHPRGMYLYDCHLPKYPKLDRDRARLLSLLLEKPDYAVSLSDRLACGDCGHKPFSRTTMYPILHDLEREGFLESYDGEPLPVRGGRPRRLYRITDLGKEATEGRAAPQECLFLPGKGYCSSSALAGSDVLRAVLAGVEDHSVPSNRLPKWGVFNHLRAGMGLSVLPGDQP